MKTKLFFKINTILFLLMLLLAECTVPQKPVLPDSSPETTTRDAMVTDSLRESRTVPNDTVPETIQIPDWIGKNFVVLPKQNMFKILGYEIYLTRDLDKAMSLPDTVLELKNHRIKSEKLSNHQITCISVEPVGTEWMMECYDSLLNRTLYMVSYKGAFKDLLFKSDLEKAMVRWSGKKIFSRRGLISSMDKNGSFSSIKVDIRDSLIVQSVTAGVTPLPVKPLWINVQSKNRSGFIPVRISWTNCMNDIITENLPWGDDIFETDPAGYGWDENVWELINNHRVIKGMTKEQVLVSWGYPISILKSQGTNGECWAYQVQNVCFLNGEVTSVAGE